MRKLSIPLTAALIVVLGCLALSGSAMPRGPAPAEPEATPAPSTAFEPPPAPKAPTPSAAPAAEPATEVPRENVYVEEMKALLASLDEQARLRPGIVPKDVIDEIAALLRDHPETMAPLLEAVENASRSLRIWYTHAVRRSGNQRLVLTLRAAIVAADPGRRRIEDVLRDPVALPAALVDLESPDLRVRLLNRLSKKHLGDPRVLSAVRRLAESDPDENVRISAISRLASSGDESAFARVLEILTDRSRAESDRRGAAFALTGSRDEEVLAACLEIVRRKDDSQAIMIFAVRGLTSDVGDPATADALFTFLTCPDGDPEARKASAWALATGSRRVRDEAKAQFEERAYAALIDLENQPLAEELHAYTMSQFTDSLGDDFRQRVRPSDDVQTSVSGEDE